MTRKSVLIVDDDEDLRSSACEVLESEGFTTLQASNGREALNLLIELPLELLPGCIVLDLMMPVMEGKTFMENLARYHPRVASQVAILVWTAKGTAAQEVEDVPLECEMLRKPVDIDELVGAVSRHCGPYRQSKPNG